MAAVQTGGWDEEVLVDGIFDGWWGLAVGGWLSLVMAVGGS